MKKFHIILILLFPLVIQAQNYYYAKGIQHYWQVDSTSLNNILQGDTLFYNSVVDRLLLWSQDDKAEIIYDNGRPKSRCTHGQACTGILAASHNNIGIAGVAPYSKVAQTFETATAALAENANGATDATSANIVGAVDYSPLQDTDSAFTTKSLKNDVNPGGSSTITTGNAINPQADMQTMQQPLSRGGYESFFGGKSWEYHNYYMTTCYTDEYDPNFFNACCTTVSFDFHRDDTVSIGEDTYFHSDYFYNPSVLLREDTVAGRLYARYGTDETDDEYLLCDLSLSVGDTFFLPDGTAHWNRFGYKMIVDSVCYTYGKKVIYLSLINCVYDFFYDPASAQYFECV